MLDTMCICTGKKMGNKLDFHQKGMGKTRRVDCRTYSVYQVMVDAGYKTCRLRNHCPSKFRPFCRRVRIFANVKSSLFLSVSPFCSRRTNVDAVCCLGIFRKSVEKILGLIKVQNNGYFT